MQNIIYLLLFSSSRFVSLILFIYLFFFCCKRKNLNALDKFNLAMTAEHLYSNGSQLVDELLHEMATGKIIEVGECELV